MANSFKMEMWIDIYLGKKVSRNIFEISPISTRQEKIHCDTLEIKHPGRTFLGKLRYFSGIAALTPLTYKQNALTPLYRQKNDVNAVNGVSVPVERR